MPFRAILKAPTLVGDSYYNPLLKEKSRKERSDLSSVSLAAGSLASAFAYIKK